jgi:uncharacterized iron-regulated membrane protein
MSFWQRWLRKPQTTWLRKAVFQLHLWSGLILGIYVVAVCVSGSAIVFRNEIYDALQARLKVTPQGNPMSQEQLQTSLQKTNPGYSIRDIRKGRDEEEGWEIVLVRGVSERTRLVDPYTGEDRGGPVSGWFRTFRWLGELHGKLLWEEGGYVANGIGGLLMSAVCLTGLVIWWPGLGRAWRAMILHRGAGWKRFNFDLHSAIGFWTFAILFMWSITGAYFVFPQPFRETVNFFTPINAPRPAQPAPSMQSTAPAAPSGANASSKSAPFPPRRPRRPLTLGGKILRGFSNAHYGTFGGWYVKALWTLLGLAPVVLFGTALVMWWNRVLRPGFVRRRTSRTERLVETALR